MSEDETNNEIKKRLDTIFPSPQVAAKVVDLVVHKRPFGWSRHSNAPYYGERYGQQIKTEADRMIESGKPILFRYNLWCNDETGMSRQTLYNRINQSIRYLVEQMETSDHRYKKWYDTVKVRKIVGVGIKIAFKVGLHENEEFKAEQVQPTENMPVWKRRMEDWLESDEQKPFCEEGLCLTPQEVVELTATLSNLSNVQASVKSESVKIIRVG